MTLALGMAAGIGSAQAGVLTYQDVVFTTSWSNNVLTLEIDAAKRTGNWSTATMLSALSLKEIGSFKSVTVTAAPKGVSTWAQTSRELTANGCAGGSGGTRTRTALCLTGAPIALTDNMVFTFAFTGGTLDLDEPHLKVNFVDASKNKVGDLLSQTIKATPVVVTPVPTPTPTPTPTPVTPTPVPPTPVVTPVPVTPTEPILLPATGNTTVPKTDDTGTPNTIPVVQQPTATEVPEPWTIALMLGGLALMGVVQRKRS
jgi:hypothetical protein